MTGHVRRCRVVLIAACVVTLSGCGGAATDPSSHENPPIVIGGGRTAVGESFVATLGGARPPSRLAGERELEPHGGCPLRVFIREDQHAWQNEVCYPRSEVSEQAGVECASGLLLIHLAAPAATRSVRLSLSDGQQIVSPVMLLPRRHGGPVALYYQAVRGPTPIPVSATELGTHGQTLGTIGAYRGRECTKNMVRTLPGARVLVTAQAPGGKTLTISSEQTRILGSTHFGLRVVVGGAGGIVAGTAALRVAPQLAWEVSRICKPYPYGIIYGVLATPSDEVLVGMGAELQPLHRVAIPASVRPHSALVYGILGSTPSRLIVRVPGAKVVLDENIRSIFAETRCA
jgi:hypothetical protein